MNAHVNSNCIACGLCASLCPGVFTLNESGYAQARDEIFPDQEAMVQEAAESCPTDAIEITVH